ncbi:hypothetical protein [Xanthomonas hortorum]|uniref:hypothetical protein n=1 Tax=Xanthomonas hortorum TaxID=56454 RepID=UPI0032E8D3CF
MDIEVSKRSLSVRLPPDLMTAYTGLIEGAGLKISENIRSYVKVLIGRLLELEEKEPLEVEVLFNWRKFELGDPYPESVGAVMVKVNPPDGLTMADLSEIIFALPEFMDNRGEPYRIDSYYFHRAASAGSLIESSQRKRNVLSFSMIEGRWHGGIYRYRDDIPLSVIGTEIAQALETGIKSTIRCAQLGALPRQRILTSEQVSKREAYLANVKLPQEDSFKSIK